MDSDILEIARLPAGSRGLKKGMVSMAELHVEGMHCKHCEMLVREELKARGAKDVHADAQSGLVTFKGDLTEEQAKEAVVAAGFSVVN
jgi:copper chaperone CopZ